MNFSTSEDLTFQQYYTDKYGSIENLIGKAKDGEIVAQADLGIVYSEGFGDVLLKDDDKAIGWLNTAVENGNEFPTVLGKLVELLDKKGTPLYQGKAYEMHLRAAKLGLANSQFNLAEMYRCGVNGVVNKDIKEAFKWYKKAADEDMSGGENDAKKPGTLLAGTMRKFENTVDRTKYKALGFLYKCYLEGDCPEGKPQPTKAVYYLTRAAEQGDTEAQLKLGQIYMNGSCDQGKDISRAKRWLRKAAASGDERAKEPLKQCEECADSLHEPQETSEQSVKQTLDIVMEKVKRTCEQHPMAIPQPVTFSEAMLSKYDWSPTARNYLKAFKLVKEGVEILYKSNFTDGKGISLIAYGYLTENSILQSFPLTMFPKILQLCENNLKTNENFFEAVLLSYALHHFESRLSEESCKVDMKKAACLQNIIHFIKRAEPNSTRCENPYEFDKTYSSWLHVLYLHLASMYIVSEAYEKAAEACENSLLCCPSFYESKRLLGYALMTLYTSKSSPQKDVSKPDVYTGMMTIGADEGQMTKYASWTKAMLRDTATKVLKEYLIEAPPCDKSYPNVNYYLANLAGFDRNTKEFKKYYELGQDAEEKRLPFLDPVRLPLKDWLTPIYMLLPNIRTLQTRCGNKVCTRKGKGIKLKSCAACGAQRYCSKTSIGSFSNYDGDGKGNENATKAIETVRKLTGKIINLLALLLEDSKQGELPRVYSTEPETA